MRILLIIAVVIIIVVAYRHSEQNKDLCKEAGYEGALVEGGHEYCYEWMDGRKVLTPLSAVKEESRP